MNVAPFAHRALRGDLPLVGLDDPPHDRQAQARASGVGRARALAAVKPLEDEGQVRLGNPHARVGDGDPGFARRGFDAHDDPAARLRVAQAVLEQVVQHLLEAPGIGEDVHRQARHLGRELEPAVAGGGSKVLDGFGDEPAEIQVREREGDAPALAARQEEQVLRDPREMPDFEDGVPDRLAVLLRRTLFFERHLEGAAEHGERRAQLVGDVGDELMLLFLRRREGVEPRVQEVDDAAAFLRESVRRDAAERMPLGPLEPARDDLHLRRRCGLGRARTEEPGEDAGHGRAGLRPPDRRPVRARGSRRRGPSGSGARALRRRSSCGGH